MLTRFLLCAALAFSSCGIAADATPQPRASDAPDPETAIWTKLRSSLFANRSISAEAFELIAPARAEDGAVVPVAIRAQALQRSGRYIRRLYLIVDNNPSPIAALIDLTPES